jgi:replicative DNA helicase
MSLTAEQEVIAALLMNPYLAKECDLSPDEFRMELYQDIYRAIRVQCDESGAFDVVTLGDHFSQTLPEQQAKHMFESMCGLAENAVGSKSMFPKYCEIIRKDNRLRQIEVIATSLKYEITENKNIDAADKAIADLMALDRTGRNYLWTLEDSVKAGLRQIEEAAEREGLVGIDTGIELLNEATGGLNNSDLIIIGARPAMGKTALLLNMANSSKVPSIVISSEQGHEQVGKRMISIEGSVDAQRMRTAQLDEDFVNQMGMAARRLINKKIWINDQPGINIIQVCKQIRECVYRYGCQAAYVDYVQKIKGSAPGMTPKEIAAEVASTLKNLAKELNIPIVALAQVNREVDKRPDKRPNMGDLANAGEIEMEADLVIMLYRDEVYNEDTPDKGIAELLIEKNRHGPIGRIRCAWIGKYMQFKPLTHMRGDY